MPGLSQKIGLLLIALTFGLSGCWDRQELSQIGIVGATGIDLENKLVKICIEIFNPAQATKEKMMSNEEPSKLFESSGVSYGEAIRNLYLEIDRALLFSHNKVIIISEEIAKKGIITFIDLFRRQPETRISPLIVIAKGNTPVEILNITGGIEDTSANYIEKLLNNDKLNARIINVKLVRFLNNYCEGNIQPVCGVISIAAKSEELNQQTSVASSMETSNQTSNNKALSVEGTAVFKKDRLLGFLDGPETLGLNLITNNINNALLTTALPKGEGKYTLEIKKIKVKKEVQKIKQRFKLNLSIQVYGDIFEEKGDINYIQKNDQVANIERAFARKINKEVKKTLHKVQKKFEVDVFGFGQEVHKKYTKVWKGIKKDWGRIFSQSPVNVKVKVNIQEEGLLNIPLKLHEGI